VRDFREKLSKIMIVNLLLYYTGPCHENRPGLTFLKSNVCCLLSGIRAGCLLTIKSLPNYLYIHENETNRNVVNFLDH
jgi:hypothetical protein